MYKLLPAILLVLIASGCATVKDYDPEKEEILRAKKYGEMLKQEEPTATTVAVGEMKNVTVFVEKAPPLTENELIERQVWHTYVANGNNQAKCVMLVWKLMDFEYASNEAARFYVPANSQRFVGSMVQKVWDLNGLRFTVPASGLLYRLFVTDPKNHVQKNKDPCELVDDKVIDK